MNHNFLCVQLVIYLHPDEPTSSQTIKCLKHKHVILIYASCYTYHTNICIWSSFRMPDEVSKGQCVQCKRRETKCEDHQRWTARSEPLQVSKRRCEPHCGNTSALIFLQCNKCHFMDKIYLECINMRIIFNTAPILLTFSQHILWHLSMPTAKCFC